MHWGDQGQQVQTEQLRSGKAIPASACLEPRPVLIQVVVRDEGRQQFQEILCAGLRQLRLHRVRRLP
jgi:hypothetical protein